MNGTEWTDYDQSRPNRTRVDRIIPKWTKNMFLKFVNISLQTPKVFFLYVFPKKYKKNYQRVLILLQFVYLCYSFFFFFFFFFYIYVMCMTLVQYVRFLLISKLDYIIKCKKLIYRQLIQYFETKQDEKEPLNFVNSLLY